MSACEMQDFEVLSVTPTCLLDSKVAASDGNPNHCIPKISDGLLQEGWALSHP